MTPIPFLVRATAVTVLVGALVACGGSGSASNKVASLDTSGGGGAVATSTTLSKKAQQDAILSYAACMRTNGVDMKDPTFDADGNVTGGGLGRNSGIDRRSTAFQTAQKACGSLIQGIDFGAGRRRNFDPTKIQAALNDFTACLRDNGLQVNDITFGRPANGTGNNGSGAPGAGGAPDGSIPPGGFNGTPPSFPAGGANAPGGAGFDPTQRLIDRLGLDKTDPKVTKALATCQPALLASFQSATNTTTTTTG